MKARGPPPGASYSRGGSSHCGAAAGAGGGGDEDYDDEYEDDGFIDDGDDDEDWRREMRQLTGYDPTRWGQGVLQHESGLVCTRVGGIELHVCHLRTLQYYAFACEASMSTESLLQGTVLCSWLSVAEPLDKSVLDGCAC